MLASDDRPEEALAELETIRPAFEAAYGEDSTHVRNLERQIARLRVRHDKRGAGRYAVLRVRRLMLRLALGDTLARATEP